MSASARLAKYAGMVVLILGATYIIRVVARAQRVEASSLLAAKERAGIVISQQLPHLDGDHLKVTLVEVNYEPGEESAPHSHPCAGIGYVVEGALRHQVKGEPERTYQAGASLYEPAKRDTLVSANASSTEPAKLAAYFVCDHEGPLSVDAPQP